MNNFKINSYFASLNEEEEKTYEKNEKSEQREKERSGIRGGLKCFRVSCVTRSLNLIVSGLFFSKRRGGVDTSVAIHHRRPWICLQSNLSIWEGPKGMPPNLISVTTMPSPNRSWQSFRYPVFSRSLKEPDDGAWAVTNLYLDYAAPTPEEPISSRTGCQIRS